MKGRVALTSQGFLYVLIGLSNFSLSTAARATIICSDAFDYGASSKALEGLNGGIGFSNAWVLENPEITYNATGLTFSDVPVSGGSAYTAGTDGIGNELVYRSFSHVLNGTYYGMFLGNVVQSNSPANNEMMCGIGINSPPDLPWPDSHSFGVISPSDDHGLNIYAYSDEQLSGITIGQGVTYLVLFKLDTSAQIVTAWELSSAQYDTLKTGGITEAALNAPPVGTAVNQVWARSSTTNLQSGVGLTASQIGIYMNAPAGDSGTIYLDELRMSDASFSEAIAGPPRQPPTPTLQIVRSDNIALLIWSTNFPGFALQQAAANSTNWITRTTNPLAVGASYLYPVDMSNSTFFRLKK